MNRKYIFGLIIFLLLPWLGQAQYVSNIIEYKPAPGQLINTETFGSPKAAESIIGNINGLVSLGAFGGSITVKMEEAVQNDPENPFGVDFTIFGNAMKDWSESGAVYVMKDENHNGLADDEWYIIAGSDYYFNHSKSNYQIEYFKPEEVNSDILWVDENQDSGFVFINSIHQNEYYPSPEFFPSINPNSQNYHGFHMQGWIDQSTPGYVRSYQRGFGYADNKKRGGSPYNIPDNPYTQDIENSGGDAIDISWARDEKGQQVFLDEIHFIKISTAINNNAGQLGEISTEIAGIIDVTPNAQLIGENKCIVIQDLPLRLLVNSQHTLNAILFEAGVPINNQDLIWSSSSENIASIENGEILAHETGLFSLTATSSLFPEISKSINISVNKPESIAIEPIHQYLQINEEISLQTHITDNLGFELNHLDLTFSSSNNHIEIIEGSEKTRIKGLSEGSAWISAQLTDFPEIKDSILVRISNEASIPKVFVSIKTQDQILFPRQSVNLFPSDIDDFIENTTASLQSEEISPENLAQAIISTFKKIGLEEEFRFKNDLVNNELYLWKVPHELPSSLEYVYGYGGRTESPYERSWIVKLNDQNIVRNFHEIEVQNHDEITIYHVNNVNEPWTLKEFTSLNDSVNPKSNITVYLEEFEMQMYQNAQVYIQDQWPISNQNIYKDQEELWYHESIVFTNSEGFAEFQIDELGEHLLSSDGQEMKIYIQQATGIEELKNKALNIYPNPVIGDYLNISIPSEDILQIQIFQLAGQNIWTSNEKSTSLNVSTLIPGTYILQIRTENSVFNQRFIRY